MGGQNLNKRKEMTHLVQGTPWYNLWHGAGRNMPALNGLLLVVFRWHHLFNF